MNRPQDFIDPPAIVTEARKALTTAEHDAQDAWVRGDIDTFNQRSRDAEWYRGLADEYGAGMEQERAA